MPAQFEPFEDLQGAGILRPDVHRDERGWFAEASQRRMLRDLGLPQDWPQTNLVYTAKANTLRGIHFQNMPHAQAKLVRVLQGDILDVVVDLRRGSPGYKRHRLIRMRGPDAAAVFVPEGFGHAVWTLTDQVLMEYQTSAPYDPTLDRAIAHDDPDLAIAWPGSQPILSKRDRQAPRLKDSDCNFMFGGMR